MESNKQEISGIIKSQKSAVQTIDPFNKEGGLGKMWQLFGEKTEEVINELNEALVA
jgi:hypothetical protein